MKQHLRTSIRSSVFCLLLVVPLVASGQTVLLQEDFDGIWNTRNPPDGWTIYFTGDPEPNDWSRGTESTYPWEENRTPYAYVDGRTPEDGDDSLVSPPFDCSGSAVVMLRCSTYFVGRSGLYGAVLFGSIGGGPYEQLVFDYTDTMIGPELQTIQLDWAAGEPEVRLAWVLVGTNIDIQWWCIDNVTVLGQDALHDVGVETVISPSDTVDIGQTITPEAVVRNYGDEPESFWTGLAIGANFTDSAYTEDLQPGNSRSVTFSDWTASEPGPNRVIAATALPGDANPDNDWQDTTVFVRVLDVGVTSIEVPADTVDSGATITPHVRVANLGTSPVPTLWCYFEVPSWFHDSTQVTGLEPSEERDVFFSSWEVGGTGPMSCICSIFAADPNPDNDTLSKEFFVRGTNYRDVEALGVLTPRGTVRPNTLLLPSCLVANNSWGQESFSATIRLLVADSTVYAESTTTSVGPGESDTVQFRPWIAGPEGNMTARLAVFLDGDMNPDNDTVESDFVVGQPHDVGTSAILSPLGTVQPGTVIPSARVSNYGGFTERFWTRFWIDDGDGIVYRDSLQVTLHPDSSTVLNFLGWDALAGQYTAKCSTLLSGDEQPANDLREVEFSVRPAVIPGWFELEPVPPGPSGDPVKRGGALALLERAGTQYVYALKGNKTDELHCFDVGGAEWGDSIPSIPGEKPVEKGGTICCDGTRNLYIIKGNNTLQFYRYTPVENAWTGLPDVPLGPSGKKVKGGTDMAYVTRNDTDYIYLLKGYKSEFYRYDVLAERWDTLPDAPEGVRAKWDKGSWIVYDGSRTIYAHKAKYYDKEAPVLHHEMWAYDIPTNRWDPDPLPGMPLYGLHGGRVKKKKSKDGSSADWYDGALFTLKGGNSQQFFRYSADDGEWTEFDTFPTLGSTQKKKRVKYGADIVSLGNGYFLCLKGNKTREFWGYGYESGSGIFEERGPVPVLPGLRGPLSVEPNPAAGRTVVRLPRNCGTADLRLVDATGMVRRSWTLGHGRSAVLDLVGLRPGVYLLQVGTDGPTTKLVLE